MISSPSVAPPGLVIPSRRLARRVARFALLAAAFVLATLFAETRLAAAHSPSPSLSHSPSPASQGATRTQRAQPALSLTGCLEKSDEPRVFLLTNASRTDDEPDDNRPTSSSSSSSAGGDKRSFRLVPLGPKVDLKSHVGEKVEVGGRFVQTDELHTTGTSKPTPPPDDPKAGRGPGAARPPTIAVAYVRTVASTCGTQPPA